MMNKKIGIVLAVIFILGIILVINSRSTQKINVTENKVEEVKKENSFLLDGFPIKEVPLYKLDKVSSNKIFVNTDPKNSSGFGESSFAYYNVVLYSDATQEEFLSYYKNLFESQIVEEFESPDMVRGKIGQYKVSAAHYGSGNTGYIQVHLPAYNDEGLNKYFLDFPDILETDTSMVEHEKSYGLLNQKGGEMEYTKYFTVINSGDANNDGIDDVDEFLLLENKYKELYKDKPEYSYDEKTGLMKWRDGDYEATLAITRDHGRLYLMIRRKLDK
jgi:hypothetical protein